MSLSRTSSREKIIIIALGVVILLALLGIGLLAARLIGDRSGSEVGAGATDIAAAPTGAPLQPTPAGVEITAVAQPELVEPGEPAPEAAGAQPVVVARQEGLGGASPVLIVSHPLYAGHRYRIDIRAVDGSRIAINGSWSQVATSDGGSLPAGESEIYRGTTPHTIDLVSPVPDPALWSCSVSAGPENLLAGSPVLVIEILDVTGTP